MPKCGKNNREQQNSQDRNPVLKRFVFRHLSYPEVQLSTSRQLTSDKKHPF